MTASHEWTEPRLPSPFDYAADLGDSVNYVVREAEDLSRLPGKLLVPHEAALTEAREWLNDALAKIAAENERNAPLPLLERLH